MRFDTYSRIYWDTLELIRRDEALVLDAKRSAADRRRSWPAVRSVINSVGRRPRRHGRQRR